MIVVVIVTHAAPPEMLHACVRSVVLSGDAGEIVVVDNGGTVDLPHDLTGRVTVLRAATNRGFGAAVNMGVIAARDAGAVAVAVLNDDVVVERGWLGPLRDEMFRDPAGGERLGAVQPLLVWAADVPGAGTVNSAGVELDRYGAGHDVGRDEPLPPADAPATDIRLFTGGAVLLSMPFLDDLGGFDERYFLYYEDVDLGLRGAERGWRYRCVAASRVHHRGGATTSRAPSLAVELRERNRIWCLFRFADTSTIARGLWLSVRRLRVPPRRVHLRALAAGLRAAPRLLVERRKAARRHVP